MMLATRRSFLGGMAAAAAAVFSRPERLLAHDANGVARMPFIPPTGSLDQDFWRELRGQFLIPPDEAFFNTGTLGSQPRVVLDAVTQHMTHVVRDISHWDYKPENEQYFTGYNPEIRVREKLASLVNAGVDEIALTQNATIAQSMVANGIELHAGDEVLLVQNEHTGGRGGWELRGKRYGAHVRYVPPPAPAESPEQLLALYENATTPQTRVWAIPHLTSGSGAILFPVQMMCRRARERGILTVIDGAQTLGHLTVDVKAMGCDAYYSSPHKWLLAPVGTGMLYLRREIHEQIWATLASGQWDNYKDGLYRLMQYGTGNLSLLVGLERAIDFHKELGSARVQERILGLANRLRAGLKQINGAFIRSPSHPALLSATTIWGITGVTGTRLQDELWRIGKVRVRSNADGVRHCCHIYNLETEVDRSLEAAAQVARAAR